VTVGQRILEAIVTALSTSRPVGVPAVSLVRAENIAPVQLPDGVVLPGPEASARLQPPNGPLNKVQATVFVWYRAAGDGTDGPVKKLDPMKAWAIAKLDGSNLGGLALTCEYAGIKDWEFAASERFFGRQALQFEVTYTHAVGNAELTGR